MLLLQLASELHQTLLVLLIMGSICTVCKPYSCWAPTGMACFWQMGGPEGVFRTEQYTLITGMAKGMLMHAVPRPGLATA